MRHICFCHFKTI